MEYYIWALIILIILIILVSYWANITLPLDTRSADIVIVGGGTSACIVAYRLSQRYPEKSIIILERGKDRRNDPIVYNVANAAIAGYTPPYSEVLPTDFPNTVVSVASMNGGGSSHNFALSVRGSPNFYNERWSQVLELSYDDLVRDYFPLIEAYHPLNPNESSPTRFKTGKVIMTQLPLTVSISGRIIPLIGAVFREGLQVIGQSLEILANHGPLRASDDFSDHLTRIIARSKNVPIIPDYNTEVVTCAATTPEIFVHNVVGIRQSTDVSYLPRSVIIFDKQGHGKSSFTGEGGKSGIQFVPNATVTRVSEDIVYWNNGANKHQTKVNREGKIIMAAGAIYTPFLLQVSGFTDNGIGRNLITHYGCTMILSVNAENLPPFSSGPLAFVSRYQRDTRDWQLVVNGTVNKSLLVDIEYPQNTRIFSLILWLLKPRTRGTVRVDGMYPKVDLNLFEDGTLEDPESDISSLLDGMRWMYHLAQELTVPYPTLKPIFPPVEVLQENNPLILERYIRQGVSLTDHYCATCQLSSVVNPETFLLRGSDNIHIVDASTFPEISDGNTNYPVMVMAEIAAKRITL